MPKIILLVFIAVFLIHSASAQAPQPTPTAEDEVVKISTNLVQVDVTVTNKDGKVIRDLKPDEFEVYQNGKRQDISNFSFVSSVRETKKQLERKPDKTSARDVLPPSTPITTAGVRRAIALVVDDLNLSWQSTEYVRQALKKFVNEQMQDGDLVAIIRTSAGIGALQQFTNDKRQLLAAIAKIDYTVVGTGNIGSFEALRDKGEIEESLPISSDAARRADDQFRASVYATGTLGALNYVVQGMAELPGRKSVLLISDGFALETQDADGNRDSTRVRDAIMSLADRANRASVVIYTMDPRGLITTGLTAIDTAGTRTQAELRQVESDRITDVMTSQQGLKYLAASTGGRALLNNNDVASGIRKIIDDQSYYLVGYVPDDETFDPKTHRFNQLSIKVTRPGTTVRYRSGFLAVAEETQKAKTMSPVAKIERALTSPFATNEIPLRLNALFGRSVKEGAFIRSLLHIRAQDLTFTDTPDGGKKVTFDIVAAAYGDSGQVAQHLSKTFTVPLKKDVYEAFVKTGFVYDFIFPIAKPGAYQLRVAVRDHTSGKVGSASQFIEVPDLKKKDLSLSSIAAESVPFAAWQMNQAKGSNGQGLGDALGDTAVRQFKRGTVLNYGLSIYNAKNAAALSSQVRLFRDGASVFEGKVIPVKAVPDPSSQSIGFTGSINLGTEMPAGDYVMQLIVRDADSENKGRAAVQYLQFEVLD